MRQSIDSYCGGGKSLNQKTKREQGIQKMPTISSSESSSYIRYVEPGASTDTLPTMSYMGGGKSIEHRSDMIREYVSHWFKKGWNLLTVPDLKSDPFIILEMKKGGIKKTTFVCFHEALSLSATAAGKLEEVERKKKKKKNAIASALRQSAQVAQEARGEEVKNDNVDGIAHGDFNDNGEKIKVYDDEDGKATTTVTGQKKFCGGCGIVREKGLLKCQSCRKVRYCDRTCQETDWFNGHSKVCGL